MTRLNKNAARKAYNEGKTVMITARNLRPEFGIKVNKLMADGASFDQFVNAFEYYNCSAETGRYAAYYIED